MFFSVRISTPVTQGVPIELENIGGAISGGSFDTIREGGFGPASLQLSPGWGTLGADIQGAHVEIFGPLGKAYEGTVLKPKYVGRDLVQLACRGYSQAFTDCNPFTTAQLKDPDATATSNTEREFSAAQIMRFMMAQASPLLRANEELWADPSVRFRLSEFDGRTPWQVQDQLQQACGYYWQVWEERIAVWVSAAPALPSFVVPTWFCDDWEPDYSTVFTRVRVTYTDPFTGVAGFADCAPNWALEAQLGFQRGTIVPMGRVNRGAAIAGGYTYLAQHASPLVAVTVGPTDTLMLPNGDRVPAIAARSNDWVQVGDRFEEDVRGVVPIVNTTADVVSGQATLTLGAVKQDIFGNLSEAMRVITAYKQGSNGYSGGPA